MTVAPGFAGCNDRRPPRDALVRQGGSAPAPDRFLAQARGQGAGTRGLAAGPHRAQSAVAVVPAVGYFAAECLVQLARNPVRSATFRMRARKMASSSIPNRPTASTKP